MKKTLNAIRLHGVNTNSLGNYLVSLGLLAAVAKRYPCVRGCWIDDEFCLISEQLDSNEKFKNYLLEDWKPIEYKLWWTSSQKADTKSKSSEKIWQERNDSPVSELAILDSHIVPTGRNVFNPVLGTGGNVGKRNLAKAYTEATKCVKDKQSETWLDATLFGDCSAPLPKLNNGGTWFVYANKTFNSGRKWSQEGLISPWSILLATEGAFLLSGNINRRLSARSRPYAVFPFVTEPPPPESAGNIGISTAEFWAPLWTNPANYLEIKKMLRRGHAQLGNRTARSPHEFAVAAMAAGVDIGINAFARFELRQTTSSQVYEAIPKPSVHVGKDEISNHENQSQHGSTLLVRLIESGWLDRLPFEPRDSKQKGKFVGLRGKVESLIVKIAENPDDPEQWQKLLLQLASVQTKADRNQNLRKMCNPVPGLSTDWFVKAWLSDDQSNPPEIEIAKSIASVGSGSRNGIAHNVFGIEGTLAVNRRLKFPKIRPANALWNSGDTLQTLLKVAQRRMIDMDLKSPVPFVGRACCPYESVSRFLADEVDLELVAAWIPPLSLIDWSNDSTRSEHANASISLNGTDLLQGLFRPMFCGLQEIKINLGKPGICLLNETMPSPNLLRRLFHLIRFNELDEAVDAAINHYRTQRIKIVEPASIIADGERIAASMLIPVSRADIANNFSCWLQPNQSFQSQTKTKELNYVKE